MTIDLDQLTLTMTFRHDGHGWEVTISRKETTLMDEQGNLRSCLPGDEGHLTPVLGDVAQDVLVQIMALRAHLS